MAQIDISKVPDSVFESLAATILKAARRQKEKKAADAAGKESEVNNGKTS